MELQIAQQVFDMDRESYRRVISSIGRTEKR